MRTLYKVINKAVDPVSYLKNLKEKTNSSQLILLESADIIEKYGDKSIGCVNPCLKIMIKDHQYTITAQNDTGKQFLSDLKDDFPHATYTPTKMSGVIKEPDALIDEESRLKQENAFDILRKIAFKYKPNITLPIPFSGIIGMISYDAIDYIETLPKTQKDLPDMEFYFCDKVFVMDHIKQKTYIIVSHLLSESSAQETIQEYEKVLTETTAHTSKPITKKATITESKTDEEFKKDVEKVKQHIVEGDIFQCVLSRTFQVNIEKDQPIDIYQNLKSINPGPYMFYFQTEGFHLLGSSPETALKVSNRTVEVKPIAGTLPRSADTDLDSRYELDLLLDEKELAEHCMLIDLARNDIAKVSKPGTRKTPKLLTIEKYSHVQHLVSKVTGELRDDLDALHAYTATMNMGTLTGAPKIKAMELIRKYEVLPRGFYGGAVGYLTPTGEFDSCIVIRAITIQDNTATVQAGAGIVHDSVPQSEADETRKKAAACLTALGVNINE